MATTGIINGTNLRIYKGGTAIAYATNCTLEMTRETRQALTKDSPGSGWTENYVGQKSGTLTTEGLYSGPGDATANIQVSDLFADFDAGTLLILKFDTTESGDEYFQASGYVTNLSIGAPVEDNSTYNATFTISGGVTRATN